MHLRFIILILFFVPVIVFAQKADRIVRKPLLIYESSFAININSDGWGFGYRYGKAKTYLNKKTWDFNFSFIRDSKQIRQTRIDDPTAKSFFYGKLMHFYNLQILRGREKIIAEKPYWGGVELRWFYYGGLNIGFGKPIYLYIIDPATNSPYSLEKYDPQQHLIEEIYGRGPFVKGLNDISVYPGFAFKMGLNVEFGDYQEKTKTIEAGIILDTYAIPVQIMGFNNPEYYMIRLYIAFRFGKRFNQ